MVLAVRQRAFTRSGIVRDGGTSRPASNRLGSAAALAFGLGHVLMPHVPAAAQPVVDLTKDLKLECASVVIDQPADGKRSVRGFVRTREDHKTAQDHANRLGLPSRIEVVAWPACEAMATLADALREPSRPSIRLAGGGNRVRIGESFRLEVTAPDFAAFLYVVYLQTDGQVVNLLPRGDVIRQQQKAGWRTTLGDGPLRFKATPPAGDEAVIVIASKSPLAELEAFERAGGRPYRLVLKTEGEGGREDRAFLKELRKGMQQRPEAERRGREVSAAVLHLKVED